VSFAAVTRLFIVVSIYFVVDSVRKLLDTTSYSYLMVLRSPLPGRLNKGKEGRESFSI
jgi:hypothetical protein